MVFRKCIPCACLALAACAALIALCPALGAQAAEAQRPHPPDAPVVLHVGDSFVHVGFSQTLKPKFRSEGARYVVRAKHSLYTPTIINGLRLPDLMRTHTPQLVILNIGGNEMRMLRPTDHAPAIRKVAEVVSRSNASCVWVTPPPPIRKGETGIVGVIKNETAPCRVFDSTPYAADLKRETFDNVHPTRKAGAKWAEVFWTWLQNERDPKAGGWRLKPRPSTSTSTSAAP